jgi:hypothetical protein
MTDWNIGPGVAQSIADHQDEARSDEQFVILREGDKISQTFGRDRIYYWIERDNLVKTSPF